MFVGKIYKGEELFFTAEFSRIKRTISVISLELVTGYISVPSFGSDTYTVVVEEKTTSTVLFNGTNLYFKFFDMVDNPIDRFQSSVSLQFDILPPSP